jgi:hypothetical protein
MDIEEYFTNLTKELESLKDRVRHYIDDSHWLSEIAQLIDPEPGSNYYKERFFGLFSYEQPGFNTDNVLEYVQDCVNGQYQRIVNCILLGKDYFVRFWSTNPKSSAGFHDYDKWHLYELKNKASAYFIHNVIDHLCPQWSNENINVWFPEDGKEDHKLSEISLYKPEQIV